MKNIVTAIRVSIIATLSLTVVVSFIYPVVVWGAAQALFSYKANGSLIDKDGKVIGSRLLGQSFSAPKYFHTRPSAAGKGYDAANSGGSNLGPISDKFLNGAPADPKAQPPVDAFAGLKQRVEEYRKVNGLSPEVKIPADAVTASASGLDPHISPRNAELQLPRVAKERGLSEDAVKKLVDEYTEKPDLGLLGEPGVNVLRLNLALDGSRT